MSYIPTLLRGDCLELMKDLPDQSVDMVLADLPYGTTRNKWDSVIDLTQLWAQYRRVCRGAIVLTAQTPFDKVLGASNLARLRYEWIWEKTEASGHLNAKKMPMKAHENVLVFYDRLPIYNPQMTQGHARKVATSKRAGRPSANYGEGRGLTSYDSTERYPRSVLRFATDKQTCNVHPTQKPVALGEYMIRTYTNPGQVVLDNTMGSGSFGVAAMNTGRSFLGMEKDDPDLGDHFYCIACQRIAAAC